MLLEPFMKHVSNILTGEVTRESGDKDNKRCDGKGSWVELPTSPMTTGENGGASAFYSMVPHFSHCLRSQSHYGSELISGRNMNTEFDRTSYNSPFK